METVRWAPLSMCKIHIYMGFHKLRECLGENKSLRITKMKFESLEISAKEDIIGGKKTLKGARTQL